jgi:hypothetical protein
MSQVPDIIEGLPLRSVQVEGAPQKDGEQEASWAEDRSAQPRKVAADGKDHCAATVVTRMTWTCTGIRITHSHFYSFIAEPAVDSLGGFPFSTDDFLERYLLLETQVAPSAGKREP